MSNRYALLFALLLVPAAAQAQLRTQVEGELVINSPSNLRININNIRTEVYPLPYVVPDTTGPANQILGNSLFNYIIAGDTTDAGVVYTEPGLTADLVYARAADGSISYGCTEAEIANDVAGKIVMISRGPVAPGTTACGFFVKSLNAEANGAIGVIIYNSPDRATDFMGNLGGPTTGDPTVVSNIPVVGLTRSMSNPIRDRLIAGQTVNGTIRTYVPGRANINPGVAVEGGPGTGFELSAARPNPTAGASELRLSLARTEAVRVEVFATDGRRVAVLHDGVMAAGDQAISFDGTGFPAGVYLVRAIGETFYQTRQVSVVR